MSLVGVNVSVGDRVQLTENRYGEVAYNLNDTFDLDTDMVFVVTRVYTYRIMVRSEAMRQVTVQHYYGGMDTEMRQVTFTIDRGYLRFVDPNYVPPPAPPAPRRLGKMPPAEEFPEGVEPIGIDHPGIQWLWEDMGRYATEQGWCPQYDALAARLGIPGRPREFDVNVEVGAVRFRATVMARSQREANELANAALRTSVTEAEEERDTDEE